MYIEYNSREFSGNLVHAQSGGYQALFSFPTFREPGYEANTDPAAIESRLHALWMRLPLATDVSPWFCG